MFKYKCHQKKLASINVLEYKGDSLAPTVILFHGYGGNSSSFSFFPFQCLQEDIIPNWIFPEGIYNAEIPSFNNSLGKAWFPLKISTLQSAIASNDPQKILSAFPLDLSKIISLINEMLRDIDVAPKKIILGGFSQGAILSTELFLTSILDYSSLVIMAGTLINKSSWNLLAPNKAGCPFLQTHGKNDNILPWSLAKELECLLINNGLKGKLNSFNGGHEIPESFFSDMKNLITKVANQTT